MEQQDFSAKDSLQLIESMISKAQNRFNENGHLYLLWGWVILVCSITSFISVYFFGNFKNLMYVWMLTIPTVIYQMIYLSRVKKSTTVRTYTDEIIGFVWLVFVIMGFLVGIIIGRSGQPQLFNPLILMLYGMPTFLSGVILKFSALRIGAISCWILALVSVFIPYQFSFLLLAVAVIITWIVPGYLLRSRFQKQH
ncbi:hypothetical protein [Lacibacter sediminis]|uniref:Uncharacterized protein n=1 Tax=Lacibacter sediminis TaxID=2760713 RepID=A0A7G5XEZ1_9BACT|nr:hypothetical protein [Lacibacter sediminis]QNA44044.1 hypothetical protein H4075_18505 [Lacibacter sediminis]